MIKYEIREGRAATVDIMDIYEGCTLNLKWSEPHTIKIFHQKESAMEFLKDSASILEKNGKFYYYTEIYLEEVEYTKNEDEISRNVVAFTNFPDSSHNSKIKKLRITAGLTQRQFAQKYGVSLDTVKSWESGRRTPPTWALNLLVEKMTKEAETN